MASANEPNDDSKERTPKAPAWTSAVLAVIALVVLSVFVASRASQREEDHEHDPLDLADPSELRQVVVAVSTVIRASDADEDRAIDALAHLAVQSPGALDLRDSCLTTYRSPREADRLLREGARLLPADGGAASPEVTPRLEEISHRARTLITEARETLDRCNTLYREGARRIGVEPARRER